MTKSISNVLLGDAPPQSMSVVLDQLSEVNANRKHLRTMGIYLFPAIVPMLYYLPIVTLLISAAIVYYGVFKYVRKTVNPMTFGAKSTLYSNMTVLVGGETLAHMPNKFPYKIAKDEWHVPPGVDIVVIDIDNVLNDDYARWAFSVADEVVVPMSLSVFDFERLNSDPRNGALFDILEQMGPRAPRVKALVFNRLRVHSQLKEPVDAGAEFNLSFDEQVLLDSITEKAAERIGNTYSVGLVREMPPSLMAVMLKERIPIDQITDSKNKGALENAKNNIERIASKVFDPRAQ